MRRSLKSTHFQERKRKGFIQSPNISLAPANVPVLGIHRSSGEQRGWNFNVCTKSRDLNLSSGLEPHVRRLQFPRDPESSEEESLA